MVYVLFVLIFARGVRPGRLGSGGVGPRPEAPEGREVDQLVGACVAPFGRHETVLRSSSAQLQF